MRVEALDRRNSPSGVPDKAEMRVEALDYFKAIDIDIFLCLDISI